VSTFIGEGQVSEPSAESLAAHRTEGRLPQGTGVIAGRSAGGGALEEGEEEGVRGKFLWPPPDKAGVMGDGIEVVVEAW